MTFACANKLYRDPGDKERQAFFTQAGRARESEREREEVLRKTEKRLGRLV